MDEPYEDPILAMINIDGSWFCPGCRSLNYASSKRCYSCRAPFPLSAPAGQSRKASGRSYKLGVIALLAVLAIAGSSIIVLGRDANAQAAGPVAVASARATETTLNLDGSSPSPDPSATMEPTPDLTPTPEPNSTLGPTSAPDLTPGPTSAPGSTPTSKSTSTSKPGSTPKPTLPSKPGSTPKSTPPPAPISTSPPDPIPAPSRGPVDDGLVALPSFPVSIPGVSVDRYAVSGSAPQALINGMTSIGSKSCGLEALACFYDRYSWTLTGSATSGGTCTVSAVNLTITYNIILPSWTSPSRVPAALPAWWQQVQGHIVWHESQHLAIARSYAESLKKALLNGPCDNAGSTAAFKAAQAPLQAAQNSFDAQQHDAGWTYPPYSGPWN
jgi:predicted secreted Zn-dependent protease